MFPPLRYIEWIHERKDAVTVDLGTSGLGGDETALVPKRLRNRPDPPDETALESLIAQRYDETVGPEHVLVTAGASHANVVTVGAVLGARAEPDPTILVERPAYEPLIATPTALGAEIRRVDRDPERDYALKPATLEDAIDETTAAVVVSNRHNPSGRLLDRAELEALATITQRHGATLIVDEVYAPYLPSPWSGPGTAFGGPTAAGIEGVIATNSLTKFFGFGGLRIGWIVADPELVAEARSVVTHLPVVAEPSRKLARRAFDGLDGLSDWSRERIAENTAALSAFQAGRPDLTGTVPAGSTFAFLECTSADGDRVSEAAFADDVLVVPGRFFDDPDRFRISVAGPPEEMLAGLERFESVLDRLATVE